MAYRKPARRARTRRSGGGYSRRTPIWTRSVLGPVPIARDTSAMVDLLPPNAVDQGSKPGRTVVRTRGDLAIEFTGGAHMGGFFLGALVVGADDAATIDPFLDANDADWFAWEYHSFASLPAYGIGSDTLWTFGYTFDFKSSRRLQAPLSSVFLYVHPTFVDVAVTTSNVRVVSSILIK